MENTEITFDEESEYEIIGDSNEIQKCLNCQEKLETYQSIILRCDCAAFCSICISNLFEISNPEGASKIFTCECGSPIPYDLFKEHVLLESLKNYLSKLSGPSKLASKYICRCSAELTLDPNYPRFSCRSCRTSVCSKCFQNHESSTSCLDYLNIQFMCSRCHDNEKLQISCKCKICQNCFISDIKDQILDDPLKTPTCKMCNKIAELQDIYDQFGGKYAFIRFQEDSLLAPRFNCNICNCDKLVDGSITLYCGHRYCRKCVFLYIIAILDSLSALSTVIECPECGQNISHYIITSIIKGPTLERYQARLLRNAKPQNPTEVLKFCNSCNYGAYLSVDATEFNCPECQKSICPKCNKPLSKNCCQETSPNLRLSLLGSLKNALTKCPGCNEAIIKASGCNFIKCSWPQCENTYFCFLCKKRLTVNYI